MVLMAFELLQQPRRYSYDAQVIMRYVDEEDDPQDVTLALN